MKESAQIAYSYISSNLKEFDVEEGFFDESTIHIHVPEGATPKDGLSAGITMASALLSLAAVGEKYRHDRRHFDWRRSAGWRD